MSSTEAVGIIPLRAGSKGLPGKNIRPFAGLPLYQQAVKTGQAAGLSRILISTDIPEVLSATHGPGVEVIARPAELSGDTVPMDAVLLHAMQATDLADAADLKSAAPQAGTTCVLLQATSPLRSADDIREGLKVYAQADCDLVMSVTATDPGILKYGTLEGGQFTALRNPAHCFMNRQALPPVYRPNGAVYVFGADWLARTGGLATDRIAAFEMPEERSRDIDTAEDFDAAEQAFLRAQS